MNGSYTANSSTTDPLDGNTPKNPYSVYIQLRYDNVYGDPGTTSSNKHNLKTGTQVPVEIIAEVDRKIDDGRPYTGSFQFSEYTPGASGTEPQFDDCVLASNWDIAGGETNCGGASLF